ncbi:hypothetical protein N0O92_00530 [Alkalihalobacillus sp. MEB130]|uniref:hypothetical protein n=1 Tax=Alkalihalobacillus sp. MEB130 TaxID=2976704 RepID=UPI0028DEF326|nr:hypothetical protein [Alkalihalobacillus sp. MEB130]MDT8858694.1 hypothetical protein [Alkalihalobacillus sp. MEB130]
MNKKEQLTYTAPLTGVEDTATTNEDSVHEALQTTWNTEQIIELNHCEETEDQQ